ncbi:MAG: hypothetical protein QF805_26440, partial [Pirellulaceae bacterium]|nr:hypothetical protein [Pirellulaceae bacterium]
MDLDHGWGVLLALLCNAIGQLTIGYLPPRLPFGRRPIRLFAENDMPRIALPAFLFAALLSLCSAEFAEAKRAQPNLIVVFCDNLGYGDIEPFGSQLHRTPNLNRMAKEGRRF